VLLLLERGLLGGRLVAALGSGGGDAVRVLDRLDAAGLRVPAAEPRVDRDAEVAGDLAQQRAGRLRALLLQRRAAQLGGGLLQARRLALLHVDDVPAELGLHDVVGAGLGAEQQGLELGHELAPALQAEVTALVLVGRSVETSAASSAKRDSSSRTSARIERACASSSTRMWRDRTRSYWAMFCWYSPSSCSCGTSSSSVRASPRRLLQHDVAQERLQVLGRDAVLRRLLLERLLATGLRGEVPGAGRRRHRRRRSRPRAPPRPRAPRG
jgi:hypothetical protein